ncbi:MAG: TIGR04076 family protein [Candidatus Hermodarchaeota archaeon]
MVQIVTPRIKITVIKRFTPEDVFGSEYYNVHGNKVGICSRFEDDQEFIVEELEKPEGFCSLAWRDVYNAVSILVFGGDNVHTEPGVLYSCCTDGVKPVCFKLERIDPTWQENLVIMNQTSTNNTQ